MLSRFAPLFQVPSSKFYGSRLETVAQKASTSTLESTLEVEEIEVGVEPEIELEFRTNLSRH
jgi:hypothetical protein